MRPQTSIPFGLASFASFALSVPLALPLAATAPDDLLLPHPPPLAWVVPAAAAASGLASTYFRTDLWLYNRESTPQDVTLLYGCTTGCDTGSTATVHLEPRETRLIEDVVASLFRLPGTSGAITLLCYCDFLGTSRTYSRPDPLAGTVGTLVPGLSFPSAVTEGKVVTFVGLASSGGDLGFGFRSNFGVALTYYYGGPAYLTLWLTDRSAKPLGTPRRIEAGRALQIADVFSFLGAPGVVTNDAVLHVKVERVPVFPYVTVIDNVSGDSVYLQPFVEYDPPTPPVRPD